MDDKRFQSSSQSLLYKFILFLTVHLEKCHKIKPRFFRYGFSKQMTIGFVDSIQKPFLRHSLANTSDKYVERYHEERNETIYV